MQKWKPPTCIICQDWVYRPMRCNKKCGTVFCEECLSTSMDKCAGNCPICKVRLISTFRRNKDSLFDKPLWKKIQSHYPKFCESRGGSNREEEHSDELDDEAMTEKIKVQEHEMARSRELRIARIIACAAKPGEIKKMLDEQQQEADKLRAEKQLKDAEATRQFLQNDAETLAYLEVKKKKEIEEKASLELVQKLLEEQKKEKAQHKRDSLMRTDRITRSAQKKPARFRPQKRTHNSTLIYHIRDSKRKRGGTWICKACTTENESRWLRCQVCESRK